jgi:hypothetical protein
MPLMMVTIVFKDNKIRTYQGTQSNVSLFLGPQFGEQNHVMKRLKPSKTDTFSGMYRAYVPTQNVDAFIRHLTLKGDGVYRT